MKLVIDISNEAYELCKRGTTGTFLINVGRRSGKTFFMSLYKAIANGKPLPKGHGRLIDADAELEGLRKMKVVDEKDKQSVRFAILEYENAQPVIEADYGEEEDEENG